MTPAKQEWITRQAIEAVLRGLIIGAMKGDPKNLVTMFRLAEQTGQFEEPGIVPVDVELEGAALLALSR